MHLGHLADLSGRWQLCVFAGTDPGAAIALMQNPPPNTQANLVLRTPHRETTLDPDILPRTGTLGLRDYGRVFCPAPSDDVFAMRGIAPEGAAVLVRPDQYIACITPLEAADAMEAFIADAHA